MLGLGDKECAQNFGEETSWDMSADKTEGDVSITFDKSYENGRWVALAKDCVCWWDLVLVECWCS
jgi:hypothetical protein